MTRAVGDDEAMMKSLQEVVSLFKEAQTSVFKLMSSVSLLLLGFRNPFADPLLIPCVGLGSEVPEGAKVLGYALST